jgi:hypothetical protein
MRAGIVVLALLAFTGPFGAPQPARAAADIDFREFRLRHVCDRGPTPGAVCCEPDDCGLGGTCEIDAFGKISGTLTLVIDDDVSEISGAAVPGRRLKALTVILETKGRRTGAVLAQTFQKLDATSLDSLLTSLENGPPDEFGFPATESLLAQFTDTTGTGVPLDVAWLIYRTLDVETLRRIRTLAGLAPDGPELLVIQPSKLKLQTYANHAPADDPLASVLRVKLLTYFVAPKDNAVCF